MRRRATLAAGVRRGVANDGGSVPVRDLKLDATGDLSFDGHDVALVSDADAIAQQAGVALSTFRGEWFLDTDAGADWHKLGGSKASTDADYDREIRRVLGLVPGIASVGKVAIARTSGRVGTITAEAIADTGELLTITAEA